MTATSAEEPRHPPSAILKEEDGVENGQRLQHRQQQREEEDGAQRGADGALAGAVMGVGMRVLGVLGVRGGTRLATGAVVGVTGGLRRMLGSFALLPVPFARAGVIDVGTPRAAPEAAWEQRPQHPFVPALLRRVVLLFDHRRT